MPVLSKMYTNPVMWSLKCSEFAIRFLWGRSLLSSLSLLGSIRNSNGRRPQPLVVGLLFSRIPKDRNRVSFLPRLIRNDAIWSNERSQLDRFTSTALVLPFTPIRSVLIQKGTASHAMKLSLLFSKTHDCPLSCRLFRKRPTTM